MSDTPKPARIKRLDSVPVEKVEYTPEGFLIDTPIVTSVGIFEYEEDGSIRRELRLPEHVFAADSLATYEGKPVIITHGAGRVSKDNAAAEIVGTVLSKGYRDGEDVRAKIIIHDTDAVKRSGMRELSLGYDLTLEETPGEWNGQPYDAVQTGIAINHLAVVREARAGGQARLNIDSRINNLKGANIMPKQKAMDNEKDALEEKRKRSPYEAGEPEKPADTGNGAAEDNAQYENPIYKRVEVIKAGYNQDGCPEDLDAAKSMVAEQCESIKRLLEIIEELQAENDCNRTGGDKREGGPNAAVDADGVNTYSIDKINQIVSERLNLGRLGDRLNLKGLETLRPFEAKKRLILALKPGLRLDGKGAAYINTAFDIAVQELSRRKDTGYQRGQIFSYDGISAADTGKSKAQAARENMLAIMKNGGKK